MGLGYNSGCRAGPYEIVRLLGRGAFGEVLLARESERPSHLVALKIIACDQLTVEDASAAREAAMTEATLLSRLRHPHIVKCEEVSWDSMRENVWIALEYLDGGDLQSLIDHRRRCGLAAFDGHFVRRVLAAIGGALVYIHGQGILHRDVKPANVLIERRSGRVKLGDFGVSKLLEATARARTMVGTPYYLAPEILFGHPYGPQADAWALGICVYELSALRRPYEASNQLALVRQICEDAVPPLPSRTETDIGQAASGLLVRDPDERMPIEQALAVSDAVAVLVVCTNDSPQLLSPERSNQATGLGDHNRDWSPVPYRSPASFCGSLVANELMSLDLSAEPDSSSFICGSMGPPIETTVMLSHNSWQESEVVAQARLALAADVDDPEELQEALIDLEREAGTIGSDGAVDTLMTELRLRIAALREDAAAMLRSLLEESIIASQLDVDYAGANACEMSGVTIAALESALDIAGCLGVDTAPADAIAASAHLLSLRITWGSAARCCLLPAGCPFASVSAEVVRRFGVSQGGGTEALTLEFKCWTGGGEVDHVHDDPSWEACLRRWMGRRGRLELSVEMPFVVMGTRLGPTTSATNPGEQAARPLVGMGVRRSRFGTCIRTPTKRSGSKSSAMSPCPGPTANSCNAQVRVSGLALGPTLSTGSRSAQAAVSVARRAGPCGFGVLSRR